MKKIKRIILLNLILIVWEDKNKLTMEVIKNTFFSLLYSNKLDDS